jgi:hypothetical protein
MDDPARWQQIAFWFSFSTRVARVVFLTARRVRIFFLISVICLRAAAEAAVVEHWAASSVQLRVKSWWRGGVAGEKLSNLVGDSRFSCHLPAPRLCNSLFPYCPSRDPYPPRRNWVTREVSSCLIGIEPIHLAMHELVQLNEVLTMNTFTITGEEFHVFVFNNFKSGD